MFSKTKIAFCVALVLGTASAALAGNDIDESASEAQAAREAGGNQLPWWWNTPAQGRGSFAQAGNALAVPIQQEVLSRKKSQAPEHFPKRRNRDSRPGANMIQACYWEEASMDGEAVF
jgi:hypothetical protein